MSVRRGQHDVLCGNAEFSFSLFGDALPDRIRDNAGIDGHQRGARLAIIDHDGPGKNMVQNAQEILW